jgi:hypothetical protein
MRIFFWLLTINTTLSFAQELEEEKWEKIDKSDSIELHKVWESFAQALEQKEADKIKKLSLPEIVCDMCIKNDEVKPADNDNIVPINTFITQSNRNLAESPLGKAIKKKRYKFSTRTIPDFKPSNIPGNTKRDLRLFEIWVATYLRDEWAKGHEGQSHVLQFVRVKGKLLFYGLSSIP